MSWLSKQWDDYKYCIKYGKTKWFYRIATVLVLLVIIAIIATIVMAVSGGVNPLSFMN